MSGGVGSSHPRLTQVLMATELVDSLRVAVSGHLFFDSKIMIGEETTHFNFLFFLLIFFFYFISLVLKSTIVFLLIIHTFVTFSNDLYYLESVVYYWENLRGRKYQMLCL